MSLFHYTPERILIEEEVADSQLTREICERFSTVPQQSVKGYAWHRDSEHDPQKNALTHGKKTLHLKRFQGNAFKFCPGRTESLVCCNYLTLDLVENCPFECTYCILQAFLNKPVITVHANLEEILQQVHERIVASPQTLFRIGTGEHSDSLALDPILGIAAHLIRFFSKVSNAVLELKTKSNCIQHLLDVPHGGKTIMAWSVNPKIIVEQEEHKTARLQERLDAARCASDAGYKVAFHVDPLIHYPGWEEGYTELVHQVLDAVPSDRIAWISLGALRCVPGLKPIVEERFPKSKIFLGELIPTSDGKIRYLKTIRERLFKHLHKTVKKLAPEIPLYLCMEPASIWKSAHSPVPNTEAMEKNMVNALQQRFPEFQNRGF